MQIVITHPLDDAYIDKIWKHVEMRDIEDRAADILEKSQEGQSIEDDLFSILYLAFRYGFRTGHWIAAKQA